MRNARVRPVMVFSMFAASLGAAALGTLLTEGEAHAAPAKSTKTKTTTAKATTTKATSAAATKSVATKAAGSKGSAKDPRPGHKPASTGDTVAEKARAEGKHMEKCYANPKAKGCGSDGTRQRDAKDDNFPRKYRTGPEVNKGNDWCGVFVNWAWTKGGVAKKDMPSMKTPKSGPNASHSQGHWATYWQKWGKDNGRWSSLDGPRGAKPGDAIVFKNWKEYNAKTKKWSDPVSGHIGVVTDVKRNSHGKVTKVQTTEGNVEGDRVRTKWHTMKQLRDRNATGFVSPE